MALAAAAAIVIAGGVLVLGPLRPHAPTIVASPNPTTPVPTTVAAPTSPIIDVANGSTVVVFSTNGTTAQTDRSGAVLRLSSSGVCSEPDPAQQAYGSSDIPTSCYDANSNNFDLATSGWVGGDAAWGHQHLYYGLTLTTATAVSVTDKDGHTYPGTLVRTPGASWYAYYVLTPWTPYTIDAQHPTPPPTGTLTVTDAQGNQLGTR
jgi:hypothetical protein